EPYEITHLSNLVAMMKPTPNVKEPYEITHLSNRHHRHSPLKSVKEPYEITHLSNAIFRPDTPANHYMGVFRSFLALIILDYLT
ncbi:MAG TPA: hypothetical protein PLW45_06220, partial [Anaerolineaceae bacterium]|nr:hypothetical protein [Anaerolineaceae bacterium]